MTHFPSHIGLSSPPVRHDPVEAGGREATLSRVDRALDMMRIYLVEHATQPDWSDDRFEELARTIAACVWQSAEGSGHEQSAPATKLKRESLRRAIRFIHENLDSKLRWDDIAAAVGLEPTSFGRAFKCDMGMTPHQYIIRCRLRRAMKLLTREELTLADIALDVGCSCQSHLTTLFRKHLGTTPGALRGSTRRTQRGWAASALGRGPSKRVAGESYFPPAEARAESGALSTGSC